MFKRFDVNIVLMITGLLLGAGLGFALIAFVAGNGSLPGLTFTLNETDKAGIGRKAPGFSLENLKQEQVSLSALSGQPVVINFWATWCGPCRIEMPLIEAAYREYSPETVFLAVNFDEDEKLVGDFAKELGLTFPILLDPGGKVTEQFNVQGFPTTYFIDAEGIVQAVHIGTLSKRQLANYLEMLGANK